MRARHRDAGKESKLHQALRDIGRQVDALEDPLFAAFEFSEGSGTLRISVRLLETHLHYDLSMRAIELCCQGTQRYKCDPNGLSSKIFAKNILEDYLTCTD